jgi:hypothetical protein
MERGRTAAPCVSQVPPRMDRVVRRGCEADRGQGQPQPPSPNHCVGPAPGSGQGTGIEAADSLQSRCVQRTDGTQGRHTPSAVRTPRWTPNAWVGWRRSAPMCTGATRAWEWWTSAGCLRILQWPARTSAQWSQVSGWTGSCRPCTSDCGGEGHAGVGGGVAHAVNRGESPLPTQWHHGEWGGGTHRRKEKSEMLAGRVPVRLFSDRLISRTWPAVVSRIRVTFSMSGSKMPVWLSAQRIPYLGPATARTRTRVHLHADTWTCHSVVIGM